MADQDPDATWPVCGRPWTAHPDLDLDDIAERCLPMDRSADVTGAEVLALVAGVRAAQDFRHCLAQDPADGAWVAHGPTLDRLDAALAPFRGTDA